MGCRLGCAEKDGSSWAMRGGMLLLIAGLAVLPACSDDTETTKADAGRDQGGDHKILEGGSDQGTDLPVVHKALSLKVAHVNDTHSQIDPTTIDLKLKNDAQEDETVRVPIGGFARLMTKINSLRTAYPSLLFLEAGDVFQGSLYFVKYQGEPDALLLNDMKVDAMSLGNHEFDKGTEPLANFIAKVKFPVLCANLDVTKDTGLKDKIKPYTIKVVDGERVALIGLVTPDTTTISSPGQTVVFNDPVQALKDTVKEVETKESVNKIVVISHLGFDQDLALAKEVEGVDVIAGGHSHTLLGDYAAVGVTSTQAYPVEAAGPSGKKVCVVQAWEKTKALGLLEVELDKDGVVQSCGGKAVLLVGDTFQQQDATTKKWSDVTEPKATLFKQDLQAIPAVEITAEDTGVGTTLQPFKDGIDALMKVEVADVAENLWHVRVPGTKHEASGEAMPKGSYIAPHICEAWLGKASALGLKADLAITNAGGARVDIPQGKLTMGLVYTLQPFGNTLYSLQVTGAEIKTVLQKAVVDATKSGSGGGSFPYVAGIRYTADLTQAAGKEITVLEIKEGSGWKAVSDTQTYTLITTSFLAGGGDGYDALKAVTASRADLPYLVDAQVFADYAAEKKTLSRPAADTGVTFIPKL
jgi:5'-nucleotidase / UDP-sugar diphosphatase